MSEVCNKLEQVVKQNIIAQNKIKNSFHSSCFLFSKYFVKFQKYASSASELQWKALIVQTSSFSANKSLNSLVSLSLQHIISSSHYTACELQQQTW